MSGYHCKKFCGNSSDFICSSCLLKEIPAQKLVDELISRKLAKVQETVEEGKRKIQGYYIWKAQLEKTKDDKE